MSMKIRMAALLRLIFSISSFARPEAKLIPAALTGMVSSEAEGRMEGVLVTAEPEGGKVRVSVFSDEQGHYAFPEERLKPGKYELAIRAVGYELPAPVKVELAAGKPGHADIRLVKTKDLS